MAFKRLRTSGAKSGTGTAALRQLICDYMRADSCAASLPVRPVREFALANSARHCCGALQREKRDASFMIRRASSGCLVHVDLEPESTVPLYQQVYDALRARIVDGSLLAGAPLPSTRFLARDLRVSRSTINLAYEQLRVEGYVEGRMGAATRVRASLPDGSTNAAPIGVARTRDEHNGVPSQRIQNVLAIPRALTEAGRPPRAFRVAVPAVDLMPMDVWARLVARRWAKAPANALAYGDPFGYMPLRAAIASYLSSARGVNCDASRVMIVNGSQQALDLTCRVTLDAGDAAWLEDPGYFGARGALTAAHANIIPVPVDAEGLQVTHAMRVAPDARLAVVTPARHLPLGVTLSPSRRTQLIAWARERGSWIFEDDYDSEFRYVGRPLAALHALDSDGAVIYAGTFSKVLFPSLRLGYVVVPTALIPAFRAARYYMDYGSPWLTQAALADFITEGHFERHIRRTRAVYQERQECLVEHAKRRLGGRLNVPPADAGMTLLGWLPSNIADTDFARIAAARKVDVLPISPFGIHAHTNGLLLGYAGNRERDIAEGVVGLSRAFEDHDQGKLWTRE